MYQDQTDNFDSSNSLRKKGIWLSKPSITTRKGIWLSKPSITY